MKIHPKLPTVLLFLCASVLALGACIGSHFRPEVLFPPTAAAWPDVAEEVERGLADGLSDGDLTIGAAAIHREQSKRLGAALEARDLASVRAIAWGILMPWAQRGIEDEIEDQEIGPGVADSLREELAQFNDAVTRLQETSP